MNTIGSVKPLSPQRSSSQESAAPAAPKRQETGMAGKGEPKAKVPSNEAGSTKDDIVRGSIDVPLNSEGLKEAKKLGEDTANQFDRIVSSNMMRAMQTAGEVAKTNPNAGSVLSTPDLQSWRMGGLEGRPLSEVENEIRDRIENNPDKPMPEAGEQSTHPGETFNQFKDRVIGFVQKEAKHYPEGARFYYGTHQRPMHLIRAWLKNGAPEDKSIDTKEMLKPADETPGSLEYLTGNGELIKVPHAAEPGIYFARHGATALNSGAS